QQQQQASSTDPSSSSLLPFDPEREPIYTTWPFPAFVEDPCSRVEPFQWDTIPPIQNFLDSDPAAGKPFLLPRQLILDRPNFRFDILRPSSTRSSCFTKAYGSHHVKSGGGLLQTEHMDGVYDFGDSEAIASLGLRFFTPSEVARLHAFPLKKEEQQVGDQAKIDKEKEEGDQSQQQQQQLQEQQQQHQPCLAVKGTKTTVRPFTLDATQNGKHTLTFPETMTAIQRFRLLGNSLNVWVVAELLRGILFAEHD
ncbi:tRNA (cytosine-5-)-methyltransferase, partial [Actinomortierella ambigua]